MSRPGQKGAPLVGLRRLFDQLAVVGANLTFGWSLAALIAILFVSGIVLAIPYQPTSSGASQSVDAVLAGPFVLAAVQRSHRWSAFLLLAAILLHLLRSWWPGIQGLLSPVVWWSGTALLFLTVLAAATGYLLPWDIKAYALYSFLTNSVRSAGSLGPQLAGAIVARGPGREISLAPVYFLHRWIFPAAVALISGLHVRQAFVARLVRPSQPRASPHAAQKLSWPISAAAPGAVVLVVILLSVVVPLDHSTADPNFGWPWPHPDWLLAAFVVPVLPAAALGQLWLALALPLIGMGALALIPILNQRRSPGWLSAALFGATLLVVLGIFVQTSAVGVESPLQGCPVCHNPSMVGGAPYRAVASEPPDSAWLLFHLRQPVESILSPP